jgi:DNA-binding HxlR family transcriptional regulator
MKRTRFSQWPCSVARTVDLLGDWWTPLVLRDAYYGVRRFDDFQRDLKIGRNILTERLNRLVDEGLLERVPYQERPVRHDYLLTDKGRDFFPVMVAMMRWGDRWLTGDEGPPVTLQHTPCDHDMHAEVVCSHCREPVRLEDVRARAAQVAGAPGS